MTNKEEADMSTAKVPNPDSEEQRIQDAAFRARLSVEPWWELSKVLSSIIAETTRLCTTLAIPIVEVKVLWLSHLVVFGIVMELRNEWHSDPAEARRLRSRWEMLNGTLVSRGIASSQVRALFITGMEDWFHITELRQLLATMQAFDNAFRGRYCDSPQAKYAEARLAARRALKENHNPLLDGCVDLLPILNEVCSQELAAYMTADVRLPDEKFLDMLGMLAHDQADPAAVVNPPARIQAALRRAERREAQKDRARWMPATTEQISGLASPENLESSIITSIDWEQGKREINLPQDQTRLLEAKMDGLNLDGSDAACALGLDEARVKRVRRTLASDRRWGRKVRRHFSTYDPQRKLPGG